MLRISYQLLETELAHFDIEDIGVDTTEKDTIVDFRPSIHDGFSKNENFIEFTINSKVFLKNEVCSITTFSRFRTESNMNFLDNLKNKEVIDFIARLGMISNSHLMGMFRVKSYGTNFSDFCIPIRDMSEITELLNREIK